MLASWREPRKRQDGPRSSGRLSCQSMQNCMISELWRRSRFRRWILAATPHPKRSRGTSGAPERMALPTRVSGTQVGNASRSSTRTARQILSRRGTLTTTGMARASTSCVMPDQGLFSVSSICRPILSDRISWASGRVLYGSGSTVSVKFPHQPSPVHGGLCPAKPGPCTAGYMASPLAWPKSPGGRHHHPFHRHRRPARIRPA